MAKYLVVIHNWFMDSKGWDVETVEAPDEQTAHEKALWLTQSEADTFRQRAYTLIPFDDNQSLRPVSRRLSIWERLTGRLSVDRRYTVSTWYDTTETIVLGFEDPLGGYQELQIPEGKELIAVDYLGSLTRDNVFLRPSQHRLVQKGDDSNIISQDLAGNPEGIICYDISTRTVRVSPTVEQYKEHHLICYFRTLP